MKKCLKTTRRSKKTGNCEKYTKKTKRNKVKSKSKSKMSSSIQPELVSQDVYLAVDEFIDQQEDFVKAIQNILKKRKRQKINLDHYKLYSIYFNSQIKNRPQYMMDEIKDIVVKHILFGQTMPVLTNDYIIDVVVPIYNR